MSGAGIAAAPAPALYLTSVDRGRSRTAARPHPAPRAVASPVAPVVRIITEAVALSGANTGEHAHGSAIGPVSQPVLIVRQLDQPQSGHGRLVERDAVPKDTVARAHHEGRVRGLGCARGRRRDRRQNDGEERYETERRPKPH